MNIGDIMDIEATYGTEFQAEIVRVFCPACSEEFMGSKRAAGSFVAGHMAYHEHENRMDTMLANMGGE